MKFAVQIMLGLGFVLLTSMVARADDLALSGNPYDSIVARNIFSLVPMPTNDPADQKPPDPPAKITPNGIMSLFGQLQVLFKVATPPKPGQPPQDQSYVMSEGDRQDGIAVTKIDEQAGMITFDNHGVIQTLALMSASDASASPTGGSPDQPGHRFIGGRFGRARDLSGGGANPNSPPTSSYASSPGGGANPNSSPVPNYSSSSANGNNNDSERLTPEAQVIMMEANRAQLQQQGDPTSVLIPPTEITDQMQGGDQNNGSGGSAAPPIP